MPEVVTGWSGTLAEPEGGEERSGGCEGRPQVSFALAPLWYAAGAIGDGTPCRMCIRVCEKDSTQTRGPGVSLFSKQPLSRRRALHISSSLPTGQTGLPAHVAQNINIIDPYNIPRRAVFTRRRRTTASSHLTTRRRNVHYPRHPHLLLLMATLLVLRHLDMRCSELASVEKDSDPVRRGRAGEVSWRKEGAQAWRRLGGRRTPRGCSPMSRRRQSTCTRVAPRGCRCCREWG